MDKTELSTTVVKLQRGPFLGDLLNSPYEVDFGTPTPSSIALKSLEVRLGNRPVCRNVRQLYQLGHRELPPDVAVFDEYDIWSITHVIGAIHRQDSYPKVKGLGYEASFIDSERVLTIEILPRTKFLTIGSVKSETRFDLGVEGHAQAPKALQSILEQVEHLGGDAVIKLSSDLKVVGQVSFSVMSPIIQAVGLGSAHCEWLFEVEETPLLGDQIMLQTVLVPRGTPKLTFKARAYALIKPSWISFPTMLSTEWQELECQLV